MHGLKDHGFCGEVSGLLRQGESLHGPPLALKPLDIGGKASEGDIWFGATNA